jgi:hypothetical protein
LAILATAAISAGWMGAGSAAAARGPVPATVTLGPSLTAGQGIPVTMDPAGLSLEYSVMSQQLGKGVCPPPTLVAELARLGSPPLQLGGLSQDHTVPPGAAPQPAGNWEQGTLYPLTTGFWSRLHCLLSNTKEPLTVGLNLQNGTPQWAAQMASEAEAVAASGLSFSFGNEPDRYKLPNWAALDKPFAGEEAAAAGLYMQLANGLRPSIGSFPLIGPELATPDTWRKQLPLVVKGLGMKTVAVHMYPLTTCRSALEATISGLLSAKTGNAPARLDWVAADARALGLPAIISEANSISCGGRPGVSNSPASAVWAMRFVLSALETGFLEVRFHFSGNSYDPFVERGGQVIERPLAGAIATLNEWLPAGSTLRKVHVAGLRATAIAEPKGSSVLILDNETLLPVPVMLRGSTAVQLTSFIPASPGPRVANVGSRRGRIHTTIPPNSVVAVTFVP